MTWNELLTATATGTLPKVKQGNAIGQVTTIKQNRNHQGCAVDFGNGYDEWFHDHNQRDGRSKYMDELELIKE